MADTVCTHLPISYEHPTTAGQLYDNLTLLLSCVRGLFDAICDATEGERISDVAYLGEHLCKELERRAEALYHFAAREEG